MGGGNNGAGVAKKEESQGRIGQDVGEGDKAGATGEDPNSALWGGYHSKNPIAAYPWGTEKNPGGDSATWAKGTGIARGHVTKGGNSMGLPFAAHEDDKKRLQNSLMPKPLADTITKASTDGWCCKCLKAWAIPGTSVQQWVRGMYTDVAYERDQSDLKNEQGKEYHQTGIPNFPFSDFLPTTKSSLEASSNKDSEASAQAMGGDEGAGLMNVAPYEGGD